MSFLSFVFRIQVCQVTVIVKITEMGKMDVVEEYIVAGWK